jgi:hypothetical protein
MSNDSKGSLNSSVTYYATEDVVQIGNWFYYNLTRHDYNHLLHCYIFTHLTISTL